MMYSLLLMLAMATSCHARTTVTVMPSHSNWLDIDRELRRQRISMRLRHRLEQEDMVGEVRCLLEHVPAEDLIYYGLEYKYLTLYCLGQLTYDEMVRQLEIAIHQFAKRQMTWFRGMERRGFTIHWIDGTLPTEAKIQFINDFIHRDL